jgi:hypothetical protein
MRELAMWLPYMDRVILRLLLLVIIEITVLLGYVAIGEHLPTPPDNQDLGTGLCDGVLALWLMIIALYNGHGWDLIGTFRYPHSAWYQSGWGVGFTIFLLLGLFTILSVPRHPEIQGLGKIHNGPSDYSELD